MSTNNKIMKMTIEEFITELSSEKETECVENFYKDENKRNNLRIYLDEMKKINPDVLLVGEAPGHLGCAITGIPFTDERIIRDYKDVLPGGYKVGGYKKEKTAKIVWDVVAKAAKLPLFWNSFPLHPHKTGNIETNDTPKDEDIERIGKKYIQYLINMYDIKEVYAIGCKAFNALKEMDIDGFIADKSKSYVRHPSRGGKLEFQDKIKEILKIN